MLPSEFIPAPLGAPAPVAEISHRVVERQFRRGNGHAVGAPPISPLLMRLFSLYVQRYVRVHFHSVRIVRPMDAHSFAGRPVVVYLNHASWWDPLVCKVISAHIFPGRPVYAPMDAEQLQRYRFLGKLGLFGVEAGTSRGAATFLRVSEAVLSDPNAMLWLTPQGRFADVRERPLAFQQGLGHLAARLDSVVFVPLALEYPFWTERTPEVLGCFGAPVSPDPAMLRRTPREWSQDFESRLESASKRLQELSLRREATPFENLLSGRSGVGGMYDLWRRWRARWEGRSFRPEHADS